MMKPTSLGESLGKFVAEIRAEHDAEITRLKEQLARTERERDQAIEVTELEECDKTEHPELYEHLWHLAELRNDLRAMRGE